MGYSEQIEVYRFTSIHVQHFFAAKYLVRAIIRSKKEGKGYLRKQGINLSTIFVLEQFQNPLSILNKLLVQKSIKAARDIVYEFGLQYLDSVIDHETKPDAQAKPHSTPLPLTDLHLVRNLVDFLGSSLRRVRHIRSSQILLFQSRNLEK